MKTWYLIFIVIIISIFQCYADNQWDTTQVPNNINYSNIRFTDLRTGYIINSMNNILKTTNSGLSWEYIFDDTLKNIPNSTNFLDNEIVSISFINTNIGYLITEYDYIFKTTNAGKNWSINKYGNYWKGDIFFINENLGWYIGEYGEINKTIDGGNSWTITRPLGWGDYYKIFFIDSQYAWAFGQESGEETGTLRSTDGGDTWFGIKPTPFSIYKDSKVQFTTREQGWALANNSMYKTLNAANDWKNINYDNCQFIDFTFLNENIGYAIVRNNNAEIPFNNSLIKTTDGGSTWIVEYSSSDLKLSKIIALEDDKYYLCCYNDNGNLLIRKNIPVEFELPQIGASKNRFSIYEIKINTNYTDSLFLENYGNQDLVINNVSFNGPDLNNFKLDENYPFPLTILKGNKQQIKFSFKSNKPNYAHNANLSIQSNSSNNQDMSIPIMIRTDYVLSVDDDIESNYTVINDYISNKIIIKANKKRNQYENLKISLFNVLGEEIAHSLYGFPNSSIEIPIVNNNYSQILFVKIENGYTSIVKKVVIQ